MNRNHQLTSILIGLNGLLFLTIYSSIPATILAIVMLLTAGYLTARPNGHCLWALAISVSAQLFILITANSLWLNIAIPLLIMMVGQFITLLIVDILLGFRRLAEALAGAFSY